MRELSLYEVEEVSGGGTNWNAVGTTLGLIGVSAGFFVASPVIATTAAFAAAGMGVYSAWSSWYY